MSRSRGFTLVEVVLAMGVFTLVVIAVVALITPTARTAGDMIDGAVATRLATGVEVEMRRVGFATMVALTAPSATPLVLVAPADGSRVLRESGANPEADNPAGDPSLPGLPPGQRYFRIEVARQATPALTYTTGAAFLAVQVRVVWPYRDPQVGEVLPVTAQSSLAFPLAITP